MNTDNKINSTTLTNNTYTYKAYQLLGKVWDFNRTEYANVRNAERTEDITKRTTGIGQNGGLLGGTLRNPSRVAIGQGGNRLNINPIYTTRHNYIEQNTQRTENTNIEHQNLCAEEFDV